MPSEREATLHRQQGALTGFGDLALRSESLDEILSEGCRLVGEGLNVSFTKIMELQEDSRILLVRAGVGWPPGVVGRMTIKPVDGTSEGYVLRVGKPAISPDIKLEKRFTYPDFVVTAGIKSLASVVIIGQADSKLYGVLQVGSLTLRDFTSSDTDFLVGYANLMAAAVSRIRVLTETRQNEQRLRMMLEGIPQLVWRAVNQGDYTWTGPQWMAHTGLSQMASGGKGWLDVVHPDDRASALHAWQESETNGTFKLDCRFLHAQTGRYVWFRSQAMPLRDQHGQIMEWIGTATDIDDQMRIREIEARRRADLEARVADRTRELTEANARLRAEAEERGRVEAVLRQSQKMEAVGQLTGGLAHDFNNMLAGISGSLALVKRRIEQGSTSDIERYIENAKTSADRAAALTHRLLAFSRRQTLDPKPTDVNKLIDGMQDLFSRTVGPAIVVETRLRADLWLTLCDPNQLENALLNLVLNAKDAMSGGGRLLIETDNRTFSILRGGTHPSLFGQVPAGDYPSVFVTDTGIGMEPEVAARAFDPFFTTKPTGEGTGLGLSMIDGFVQQSGGRVVLHSQPGRGTKVSIFLPRHLGALDRIEQVEGPILVPAGKGAVVLLVEDDPGVRMVVTEFLTDLGYHLLVAVDTSSALRIVMSDVCIDLLLTDVGLPGGMNGRQLADAVREQRPSLKVLFVTGYAADSVAVGGDRMGPGMEILTKPFELDMLASKVTRMIGNAAAP